MLLFLFLLTTHKKHCSTVGLEHNLGCQRATTQLAQLMGDTLPNVCFQIVVLIIYATFVKQCLVLSDKEEELATVINVVAAGDRRDAGYTQPS